MPNRMPHISFLNQHLKEDNQLIAIFVNNKCELDPTLISFDQQIHGLISKTLQSKQFFKGDFCETKYLSFTSKNHNIITLLIVGLGDETKLNDCHVEELGAKITKVSNHLKISTIGINLTHHIGKFNREHFAALISSGVLLASYTFDKYLTKQKPESKKTVSNVEILVDNVREAEKIFIMKKAIAASIFFVRDLGNEPGNVLYPESYAEKIVEKLEPLGIEVEVLGEREMKNLGMGALLGVGQGSQQESKLVVMKYNGTDKEHAPVALVGKGVTFDTGGISIKPSNGMWEMKYDMLGSAAVVGTIKALALRSAKVNVVGVIGLVENMPGGNAQRPGDIVHTMSGQTAEVLDTDAEGRLVLADAIWYAQEKFKPKCVIDLATLTGAIMVALGHTYAGCFANDDELAKQLIAAGEEANEKLWRMPLHKDYDDMIKSEVADVANLGCIRGVAGSSAAAHFIGRFIKEGMKWAHLDIAGVASSNKGIHNMPKGAVGYGVKLLNKFISDNYEDKT